MLCPHAVDVCGDLAAAYSAIVKVDAFAYASRNTTIGRLSPDPGWLPSIRNELSLLGRVGGKWSLDKPNIWSNVLVTFKDYHSCFHGMTEAAAHLGDDRADWLEILNGLQRILIGYHQRAVAAEQGFASHLKDLSNVETILSASLDRAWQELAAEEAQLLKLEAQVTRLQDRVDRLQEDIGAEVLSSGGTFTQSAVSISYELVTAAEISVPYLAIAGMVYTVGKLAYDLIHADHEIAEAIDQIVKVRTTMSQTAQAAAMTKTVIRLINHFDLALARIQTAMPKFDRIWSAEADKVTAAISALKAGARPSEMTDLAAMPAALEIWKQLADYTDNIVRSPEAGRPVTIVTAPRTERS